MQIVFKNTQELIPYDNNPRHNEDAVDFVANSIKEFGFKNPIIIDKDDVIIAGHTRLAAAQKLHLKEVPCIYADDLTDDQVRAFRLADNKTAEFSKWDFQMLDFELSEIEIDMSDFGFEHSEYDSMNIDGMFSDEAKEGTEKEKEKIICPHCGKEIEI